MHSIQRAMPGKVPSSMPAVNRGHHQTRPGGTESQVTPRRRAKHFELGRASMLRTGTTNRIPSTAATSPPLQGPGQADVGLGGEQYRFGGGAVLRAQVVLVDVGQPVAGHPGG